VYDEHDESVLQYIVDKIIRYKFKIHDEDVLARYTRGSRS
jgi:hypothetical protein